MTEPEKQYDVEFRTLMTLEIHNETAHGRLTGITVDSPEQDCLGGGYGGYALAAGLGAAFGALSYFLM